MALATLPGLDLRDGVEAVVAEATADLDNMWRQFDDIAQAEEALRDVLPGLVMGYGEAAGALAADWYDEERDRAGVRGYFTARLPDLGDAGSQALIGWATSEATTVDTMKTLVDGGVHRRIAKFSRLTISGSAVADPGARGWQRVGSGGCTTGFCDMLIGRGAVYTEATASFAAHDHCKCSAVPAWGGKPVPVQPFRPSLRHVSEADRVRLNRYLAATR